MDGSYKAPPPASVGERESSIDTPALIIDLNVAERNMKKLSKFMEQWPDVAVRIHSKAHKTPALAKLQVEEAAVGVCCQTVTEAEAMVYEGDISDVLISNQVIGKKKLRRLASLTKKSIIAVCVDSKENIDEISEVASDEGVTFGILVEVNVGGNRCGVSPGAAAADLAEYIASKENITFKGLQCYQGVNQHTRSAEERKNEAEAVADRVRSTLKALKGRGIECSYVTGGGTGTFKYEANTGVYTEVQPGSYVLMDGDYALNNGEGGRPIQEFEHSLFVLTTVQSRNEGVQAVCDVGLKAHSIDSGLPKVVGVTGVNYENGGDNHGILTPDVGLKVGDKLRLIPSHCDPTCNLYDWMVGVRDGVVEVVWPILARGP